MHADAARLQAIEDASEEDSMPPRVPGAIKLGTRKVPLKRPEGPPGLSSASMCYLLPKFGLESVARSEFPDEFTRAPHKC